jgi:hypothetical protein
MGKVNKTFRYNNIKSNAMHFLIRKNENLPEDPVGKAT